MVAQVARTARARRRRRGRRPAFVALVLLALWLSGRGLGWFGRSPEPAAVPPAGPPAVVPPADAGQPGAAPGVLASAAAAAGAPASPAAAEAPAEAPAEATTDATAAPAGETRGAAPRGLEPDRFASLMSLVDLRLEQRELGRAFATLDELLQQPLDAAQREAVLARRQKAFDPLVACQRQIEGDLAVGRIHDAAAAVRRLLAGGPATAGVFAALGLGDDPQRPPTAEAEWRMPEPLARSRAVRVRRDGQELVATVTDSRSDRLTLRLASAQGLRFPTVAATEVEPVEPTAAEAVALGWAALRAGQTLRARLWQACAARLDGQRSAPGHQELAAALR